MRFRTGNVAGVLTAASPLTFDMRGYLKGVSRAPQDLKPEFLPHPACV
jgi:hypothetical protein